MPTTKRQFAPHHSTNKRENSWIWIWDKTQKKSNTISGISGNPKLSLLEPRCRVDSLLWHFDLRCEIYYAHFHVYYRFACMTKKHIYAYIYRSSGGTRIDSDGREKWMCAAMRSVDEQRLSHYGDIKHTSGTHIILWAIKMLGEGAWQRSMLRNNRKTEEERGR